MPLKRHMRKTSMDSRLMLELNTVQNWISDPNHFENKFETTPTSLGIFAAFHRKDNSLNVKLEFTTFH